MPDPTNQEVMADDIPEPPYTHDERDTLVDVPE
jgi:hypothetical protein